MVTGEAISPLIELSSFPKKHLLSFIRNSFRSEVKVMNEFHYQYIKFPNRWVRERKKNGLETKETDVC